jgi:hypothetical protein
LKGSEIAHHNGVSLREGFGDFVDEDAEPEEPVIEEAAAAEDEEPSGKKPKKKGKKSKAGEDVEDEE